MANLLGTDESRSALLGLAKANLRASGVEVTESALVGECERIESVVRGSDEVGSGHLDAARTLLGMRGVEESYESLAAACDELFPPVLRAA